MRDPFYSSRNISGGFGGCENCSCGGRCGCGQNTARRVAGDGGAICGSVYQAGFGASDYPRLTALLTDYVEDKIARGEPFYLSPDLNSGTVDPTGKGFGFLPIFAAIAAFAAKAAPVVIAAAGAKAGADTAKANKKAANAAQAQAAADLTRAQAEAKAQEDAAAALAAQRLTIPAAILPQAVAATRADVFGGVDKNLLIIGGVALAALLLMR